MFVTFDDIKKLDQKFLSSWKQLFFEMFISVDLLGANEKISSFGQKTWKNLVEHFKLFPEVFHVGDNQKD